MGMGIGLILFTLGSYSIETSNGDIPTPTKAYEQQSQAQDQTQQSQDSTYSLEITSSEGGTIPAGLDKEIGGIYKSGDRIGIVTRSMGPGYEFMGWESLGGGEFDDTKSSTTIFTMPSNNVIITAVYRPKD